MPEVTIITAVKNGNQHIAETMQSMCGQTFRDWEYIIIDDYSYKILKAGFNK